MEDAEYRRMFAVEDTLWWYRALRLYLGDVIRATVPARGVAALDAGCGSGANTVLLADAFTRVTGCDLSEEAVRLARRRGLERLLVADVNRLPLRTGAFDCVLCADVFESLEVDERRALEELARVTKPGGRLVLSLAAFQFLLSEHDRAVHSVRRYTKARARAAFAVGGVRIARMRYLFGFLFVPIVAYRLGRGLARRGGSAAPRSDLFRLPRLLDAFLYAVVRLERFVARWVPLPFGTTLLVELERV
jgi:SAM-dependent methyltransferase